MPADLQSLLERIQAEGVEKANTKAAEIIAEAEKTAAKKIADAEKRQQALQAQAKADASVLKERTEQAIQQAARDVALEVGQSIQQTLERVLLAKLNETLSGDFLQIFLENIIKAVAAHPEAQGGMQALVSEDQAKQLAAFATSNLSSAVAKGLSIAPNKDVKAGIRVMIADGRIEHDFTNEAIMNAMSKMMSPTLAKMVFGKS